MSFLAIVKLVLQLLPLIEQIVQAAEDLFPQQGAGAQKLSLVKGALETAYSTGNAVEGSFEQIWPTVNNVVTNIVAAKRALQGGAAAQVAP